MITTGYCVQNRYSLKNTARILEAGLPTDVDIFIQESQT
jgi:hypothetical protein